MRVANIVIVLVTLGLLAWHSPGDPGGLVSGLSGRLSDYNEWFATPLRREQQNTLLTTRSSAHSIDMVVTWVRQPLRPESDELLRYNVLLARKNLKWLRYIWIVAHSPQRPSWTLPPGVMVIHHTDFMCHATLPTYNSLSIECELHTIPGLSERWIYANDDTLVCRPLLPHMFFDGARPRFKTVGPGRQKQTPRTEYESLIQSNLHNLGVAQFFTGLHQVQALTVTLMAATVAQYPKAVQSTLLSTHRRTDNIMIIPVALCLGVQNHMVLHEELSTTESRQCSLFVDVDDTPERLSRVVKSLKQFIPPFVCVNNIRTIDLAPLLILLGQLLQN